MNQTICQSESIDPTPFRPIRQSLVGKRTCDCGEPAALYRNSSYICQRCADLESIDWHKETCGHGRSYDHEHAVCWPRL